MIFLLLLETHMNISQNYTNKPFNHPFILIMASADWIRKQCKKLMRLHFPPCVSSWDCSRACQSFTVIFLYIIQSCTVISFFFHDICCNLLSLNCLGKEYGTLFKFFESAQWQTSWMNFLFHSMAEKLWYKLIEVEKIVCVDGRLEYWN